MKDRHLLANTLVIGYDLKAQYGVESTFGHHRTLKQTPKINTTTTKSHLFLVAISCTRIYFVITCQSSNFLQ